ncbi:MAG: glycosyltransferase family 39 protein [Betaproteobacteria bacterium]|nr:MAG: glycosyltransferase family 39 protein [Betaproteobacteria bacterium]
MISRRGLWLLLAVFAAVWFCNLGYRHLFKPDEGRYAEIPREMTASGDWLTPRLNGFKYFEKPALQYWATAAAFGAFGQNEWAARLWPGLAGFFGVLLVFWAGNRLFAPPIGLYGALVAASSAMYVLIGHFLSLDMALAFFMSASVFAIALAQRDESGDKERRRWMLAAWAAAALAVLSKGLVGIVLPAGAVVLYVLIERDWKMWTRFHVVPGGLLFLAIAAPWFVAVSLANPEFFRFFFIHEHVDRFLTRAPVVFRSRAAPRDRPLDREPLPRALERMGPATRSPLPAAAVSPSVVRGRFRVLFGIELEARLLYPAHVSGACAARRPHPRLGRPAHRYCAGGGRGPARDRPDRRGALRRAPRRGRPSGRTARGLRTLADRGRFGAGRRRDALRVACSARAPRRRGPRACLRRPRLRPSRRLGARGAFARLFRVSYRPENPGPAHTGCPFLRGEHLRSHAAVLPGPDRDHGVQQGRVVAADRLGAAEIPAR